MIRAGVDWGSSSFRAYCFNEQGDVIDCVANHSGIREINAESVSVFENILFDNVGKWLSTGDSILLSGMITSKAGWIETQYMACPQDVTELAFHASRIDVNGCRLLFLPGIKQTEPVADVMRGEELQLLGACNNGGSSTVVLPGTHSKWAKMNGNTLTAFRTIMTGELFELVRHQSLVGAIATSDTHDADAFIKGVQQGYSSDTVVSDLFTLRSSVLLEQVSASSVHSRLSGLLIGREIREGQQLLGDDSDAVILVGADRLCDLYKAAFKTLGTDVTQFDGNAAVSGFRLVANSLLRDDKFNV